MHAHFCLPFVPLQSFVFTVHPQPGMPAHLQVMDRASLPMLTLFSMAPVVLLVSKGLAQKLPARGVQCTWQRGASSSRCPWQQGAHGSRGRSCQSCASSQQTDSCLAGYADSMRKEVGQQLPVLERTADPLLLARELFRLLAHNI